MFRSLLVAAGVLAATGCDFAAAVDAFCSNSKRCDGGQLADAGSPPDAGFDAGSPGGDAGSNVVAALVLELAAPSALAGSCGELKVKLLNDAGATLELAPGTGPLVHLAASSPELAFFGDRDCSQLVADAGAPLLQKNDGDSRVFFAAPAELMPWFGATEFQARLADGGFGTQVSFSYLTRLLATPDQIAVGSLCSRDKPLSLSSRGLDGGLVRAGQETSVTLQILGDMTFDLHDGGVDCSTQVVGNRVDVVWPAQSTNLSLRLDVGEHTTDQGLQVSGPLVQGATSVTLHNP